MRRGGSGRGRGERRAEQRQVRASAGEGHAATTDGGGDGGGGDNGERGVRDGGEGGVEDGGEGGVEDGGGGGGGQLWERGWGHRRRGYDSAAFLGAAAVGSSRNKPADKEITSDMTNNGDHVAAIILLAILVRGRESQ